ncbi:MAG: hypothetical protein NVSMB42_08870 [Herpetosiphon sp.]
MFIDSGKVYYVLKDFPVTELHPQAILAAEAAECSGEQGKYMPMHALLFENQSGWDSTTAAATAAFRQYAEKLSLDASRFGRCMEEHRYEAKVRRDMAEGKRLGTSGTPTFLINGKLLVGAAPTEHFVNAINNELAR